jgi:hypothetical protein
MKNTVVLFLLGLVFFSCSSDDSGNNFSEAKILGKWNLVGISVEGGEYTNYAHECETKKDFQEFLANQELTFNKYNEDCVLVENEVSAWELKGNKLIVSNTHFDPMIYTYYYTVVKLTSNELVIESKDEDGTARLFLAK